MENTTITALLMAAWPLNYKTGEMGCKVQGEGFSTCLCCNIKYWANATVQQNNTLSTSITQPLEYLPCVGLLKTKVVHL